ncbi:MAG TPA: PHP domain-containing protein [Nitrospira sp.]|nr:PHP domain-containing protein [Nitrospira sp.]MBX3369078.1 PHP domain-containing protein [Nitrospira sp.]MBX7039208.1 PHP domain-containing protein [Nitrospira sp.]MCW5794732.1 PHP domain-containing protein [Nitrospira sp.]HMU28646.1 PHP domain-containing protein [Nitrospira sp.]
MSRIDLHLHTTHSDGSCSTAEVMAFAKQAGLTALAITDHDIVDGIPEATAIGKELGIEVVPGVEISSRLGESELHILGYFLNWTDPLLAQRLSTLRDSRHLRNPKIVQRLNELGIPITYEEVRALAGTESVGRPHIARLLMEKKFVTSAKEAFDRYLANGRPAFVDRELPEPAEAVRWIREAGGVPVLAHPTWVRTSAEGLRVLVRDLKAAGLGGMEVHYSTHTPSQTTEYLDLARQCDLLVTGGSDFHGVTKPDIEVGIGRGQLKVSQKLLDPLRKAATSS